MVDQANLDPAGLRKKAGLGRTAPESGQEPMRPIRVLAPRGTLFTLPFFMNGTVQQVGDSRPDRCYFLVQNLGKQGTPVYVAFNNPPAPEQGYEIRPGGFYEPLVAPITTIYVYGTGGEEISVTLGYDPKE